MFVKLINRVIVNLFLWGSPKISKLNANGFLKMNEKNEYELKKNCLWI